MVLDPPGASRAPSAAPATHVELAVPPGVLGLRLRPASDAHDAVVTAVRPDGGALGRAAARFGVGDRIVAVEGRAVRTLADPEVGRDR